MGGARESGVRMRSETLARDPEFVRSLLPLLRAYVNDAERPVRTANLVDFGGRTGYAKTAMKAGESTCPEAVTRTSSTSAGPEALVRPLKPDERTSVSLLSLTFGVHLGPEPGVPAALPDMPLPTKIVMQMLEPVDARAQFGEDPDPRVVDAHIRKLMESALDELARHRPFPIIGYAADPVADRQMTARKQPPHRRQELR